MNSLSETALGLAIIREAISLDEKKIYKEALTRYAEGIEILSVHSLSIFKNHSYGSIAYKRIKEYKERALKIYYFLNNIRRQVIPIKDPKSELQVRTLTINIEKLNKINEELATWILFFIRTIPNGAIIVSHFEDGEEPIIISSIHGNPDISTWHRRYYGTNLRPCEDITTENDMFNWLITCFLVGGNTE